MSFWTHQELDVSHAEGVGASDVISQSTRRRHDNMWLVGQLQRLTHHVCQSHSRENVSMQETQSSNAIKWNFLIDSFFCHFKFKTKNCCVDIMSYCTAHLLICCNLTFRSNWKNRLMSSETSPFMCFWISSCVGHVAACTDVVTHSTDDDAVSQTQRLSQDPKLFRDLIGQLPAWHQAHHHRSIKENTHSLFLTMSYTSKQMILPIL